MSMVFGLKQSGSWGGSPRCPERPPEGPGSPRAPGGIALAQPPALPRVPEGCISLIAGLLLAVRSATVLMVPSSPPAWARAAQSGWLGAAARHPTPVCPVALAILRPAGCRQGALPAVWRGVGEVSGGLPNPEGAFPTGLWQNSV